jgi:alkylated DNA repair dioxygenase AlkB
MTHQPDLFDDPAQEGARENHLGIPGLVYLPRLLRAEEQQKILGELDKLPWLDDLQRRVQHFGYKYDYKARAVDPSMYVGPLPAFALEVADKLLSRGLIQEMPDQLIVNEYRPGQGISAHVDCVPCFKNIIVTVSLGSSCEMDLIDEETKKDVRSTLLEPGSALVLKDDARYKWMHRIRARMSDHGVPRERRVSLTFRNVILQAAADKAEGA